MKKDQMASGVQWYLGDVVGRLSFLGYLPGVACFIWCLANHRGSEVSLLQITLSSLLMVAAVQLRTRHSWKYGLDDAHLYIRQRLRTRKILLVDIAMVTNVGNELLQNGMPWKQVCIRLSSTFLAGIVVRPWDAEQFLEDLAVRAELTRVGRRYITLDRRKS